MKILNPFLASRPRTDTPASLLVMHATAGNDVAGAIATLRDRGLSYHYIIDRDGEVTKCCPISNIAFHAGSSYGPHEQASGVSTKQKVNKEFMAGCSVNHYSVGISFVNLNNGKDPITKKQFDAAVELVNQIRTQCPLQWVTTHRDVSPGRKTDPNTFDIATFAKAVGLEYWRR